MKNIFLLSFMLLPFVFSGCTKIDAVSLLLEKDENVSLRSGQDLNIELEANPTTGYTWSVLTSDTEGIVKQIGSTYIPGEKAKSGLVGAGGIQRYQFQAVKKGKAILVFQYSRSWEKDTEPAKRFVVQITVDN